MTSSIAIYIMNYRNDENALYLKKAFSIFFPTFVIDTANTKINKEFIQFKENLYYSGCFNKIKEDIDKKDFTWMGLICSDVQITIDNIRKICLHLQWISASSNVGQYQPSFDIKSYKWRGNNNNPNIPFEEKILLDGPIFFSRTDVLKSFPFIDTKLNLYGCGISRCFSLFVRKNGYINVFDNTVQVTHLQKTGYSINDSKKQAESYIKEFVRINKIDEKLLNADSKQNSLGIAKIIANNKKVIYTCITGNYDTLLEPKEKIQDFDYICFSDTPFKSNIWKVLPIPEDLKKYNTVKQQRLIKILPHKYLSNYDESIWIDANIRIDGNIDDFYCTVTAIDNNKNIFFKKHPERNCIYKEFDACKLLKNINKTDLDVLKQRYINEGMPHNLGLFETNVIIRRHNQPDCIKLMNLWAEELIENSHRDQLSLTYCLWKLNAFNYVVTFPYNLAPEKKFYKTNEPYFFFRNLHKKYDNVSSLKIYSTYYKPEQEKHIEQNAKVIGYNTNNPEFSDNVLNKYWSEYIVMKNIWKKGKQSDYIGFDQYDVHFPYNDIEKMLSADKVLFYAKMNVSSIKRQFTACHTSMELDSAIEIINQQYGNGNKYTDYLNNGTVFYYKSCFVMSWENYDKMCKFLFGILDALDKKYGLEFNPDKYKAFYEKRIADGAYKGKSLNSFTGQCRGFGFLAERLLSAWLWINIPHGNIITVKDGEYKKHFNDSNTKKVEPSKQTTQQTSVQKKVLPKPTVVKRKPVNRNGMGQMIMKSLYGRY